MPKFSFDPPKTEALLLKPSKWVSLRERHGLPKVGLSLP